MNKNKLRRSLTGLGDLFPPSNSLEPQPEPATKQKSKRKKPAQTEEE